jgi:hypothetical protein
MRKFKIIIVSFVISIAFVMGCRRLERPEGMPDLTPCTISVTFGGEIMEDVGIILTPIDKTNNWSAAGKTDKEGKTVLKTRLYFNGVAPGNYTISFQKYAEPELSADGMALPAKLLIPKKYTSGNSKEIIEVTTDKSEYNFTLEGLK